MWGLAIIIIPAFALWGGISFLQEKQQNVVAKINGQAITQEEFKYYVTMAQLYFAFLDMPDKEKRVSKEDVLQTSLDYLLLLWKADKENIRVSDNEVIETIKKIKNFSQDGKFDKEHYLRFLKYMRIEPRAFEEYIRNFLKIDKLYQKHIKINLSDAEAKKLYKKDTQTARINYIFIPYDKFKEQIKVTQDEIKDFYEKNKSYFRQEPKIKIKYAVIKDNQELMDKVIKNFASIKTIDELKTKYSVDVKETEFIGKKDPIEGLGWQPAINQIAFSLKKKRMSQPLQTSIGYIFLQKEDEKASYIPELSGIQQEVEDTIKTKLTKDQTQQLAEKILQKINEANAVNLKKIADQEHLDYKETGNFKFYDYIEGMGLNEKVSKIIFSLKKGKIYPYPLFLSKGTYIVELKDISTFDEKDFTAKRDEYIAKLEQSLELKEKMRFLANIKKEAKAKF
jgi:peptidyl-prolyl cis-trans isomerase D